MRIIFGARTEVLVRKLSIITINHIFIVFESTFVARARLCYVLEETADMSRRIRRIHLDLRNLKFYQSCAMSSMSRPISRCCCIRWYAGDMPLQIDRPLKTICSFIKSQNGKPSCLVQSAELFMVTRHHKVAVLYTLYG